MPTTLKAVRVILIIRAVIAVLLYGTAFLGLLVLMTLPAAEVEAEAGMSMGALVAALLLGILITVFEVYVIAQMGKGGPRARFLLRIVVGLAVANAVLSILTGSNPALGLGLAISVLLLAESASSKEWFRATDPNAPAGYPPAPGVYPGQVGQSGHPGQGGQGGYPQPGQGGQGGYPQPGQGGQGGYPQPGQGGQGYPQPGHPEQGGQGYPQPDQGGYPQPDQGGQGYPQPGHPEQGGHPGHPGQPNNPGPGSY
ncbi:hypothetical protein Q8791_31660 [Nocardiopsis sp. CT-R113]|uniref:Uncharacterized protein n=1 Tax=Nocardiopsis codii TaxID=3065942 RepID=A0ABU7KHV8_9ACTN|nr:hypothetical protein [Nocardiopsis sp. CT-R113]MEE2041788.1 hypothetical protein [Nocardiopsis sp. CT-R113]